MTIKDLQWSAKDVEVLATIIKEVHKRGGKVFTFKDDISDAPCHNVYVSNITDTAYEELIGISNIMEIPDDQPFLGVAVLDCPAEYVDRSMVEVV